MNVSTSFKARECTHLVAPSLQVIFPNSPGGCECVMNMSETTGKHQTDFPMTNLSDSPIWLTYQILTNLSESDSPIWLTYQNLTHIHQLSSLSRKQRDKERIKTALKDCLFFQLSLTIMQTVTLTSTAELLNLTLPPNVSPQTYSILGPTPARSL